ncbi:SAM-dependent methyltransferase [Amycolatopsis sp. RTGN1]|uniref:SAM-dependent methyltransferase n=1 Tax=Amycolatopsis ponsaeliensis TaxID=2992142 RepID=UPI00254A7C80|nr:SAM-dependent methyltransferase [Amycolatopsis sp. RTGN1]
MTTSHHVLPDARPAGQHLPAPPPPHTAPAPTGNPTSHRAERAAPWWTPSGVDHNRINLAFFYDACREAKNSDNRDVSCVKFAHDNELDAALLLDARVPGARAVFRSERAFLDRAAAYLVARQGVSSIVVAGAGLPHITGDDDLHSVVRLRERATRNRTQNTSRANVIYVERDPLTLAHLRTIADPDNGVHVVEADPWDPTAMWDTLYNTTSESPGLVSRDDDHVALLLGGVMSFHGGSRAEVAQVVQDHFARLPDGAFLAMTHLLVPDHSEMIAQAREFETALRIYGPGTGSLATRGEIEAMIAGTNVVTPGIVPAFGWYPEGPPNPPVCGHFAAAVLAQKPGPDNDLPEPPWRPQPEAAGRARSCPAPAAPRSPRSSTRV